MSTKGLAFVAIVIAAGFLLPHGGPAPIAPIASSPAPSAIASDKPKAAASDGFDAELMKRPTLVAAVLSKNIP
jgi:hypothetical protein